MKRFFFSLPLILAAVILLTAAGSGGKTAGVRTDALGSDAWECSCWISAADAPVVEGPVGNGQRAADGASWFACTPSNRGKVVSVVWMTTGLGVYELYLNGKPVGTDILKPGFTHYGKTRRSFTYDITGAFDKAAGASNSLSAQVTPGWWADKIITGYGHEGMQGRKCAFRSVLRLDYEDGGYELFGTDTLRWTAGIAGPVKHAAIFDGETYDARELPGYLTPEKLSVPEVNTEFSGEILPSEGAEICRRFDLALDPVRAYVWEGVENADAVARELGKVIVKREYRPGQTMKVAPGETLVIDFGQNAAAVPDFVFSAAEGVRLECLPAELLNDGNGADSRGMDGPEGSVHRRNLRIPDQGVRLDYIFAGRRIEKFIPACTFFGYRFISITADGEVTIRSVRSIPVSSIAKEMETGSVTTGNGLINKLISNTVWGMRSNYLSVPTDCPQRDERLGWTADTQVFAGTGTFFADTDAFFHKWLRDLRDTQTDSGAYPGVAPKGQYGADSHDMMRLGWADAGVIVPWTIWKQFGDAEIIEESWDSMEKFMDHVAETKYDHEALVNENGNYQWADWLSYEPLESCSGKQNINVDGQWRLNPDAVHYWSYLGASYWAIDAAMMRDMAAATGRDAEKYAAMHEEATAYLKEKFLTADGRFRLGILNDMQTPALFALKNGLVDGQARERMLDNLRRNISDHGGCLQTGFLGTSVIMQVLTENGLGDVAYGLLFQRRNPSWLYSIDNGATTIWERWNSYTLENGMGPSGMNSFNHYAYGAVCQWIWESAAGIAADPEMPGFRHIIMRPLPDRRLGHLTAEYRSPAGLIRSAWKYEGDSCVWDFTVPQGAYATVTLPGHTESTDFAAGTYRLVF